MMRLIAVLLVALSSFAGMSALMADRAFAHHSSCMALHEAAFLDEPGEISQLIDHGTNVECLDTLGQTPLVTAVNGASLESFDLLLRAGAKVNVRTEYGQSLLTHAEEKYASLNFKGSASFRKLYQNMIVSLEAAGASR